MSLELVLLVPVLVLLTLFVLWAGRGGRAGLTADLAAEEAATAAALCCEEDTAGAPDREALVENVLAARPGLEYLCVGGLRPEAPPAGGTGPSEFVSEDWLRFDSTPGVRTGGLGVLGVQFSCETDGAVAPLRGLFPTVTFHGQASEVVVRQPLPPDIGFEQTVFRATEGAGTLLEFKVTSGTPAPIDMHVNYTVLPTSTATSPADYQSLPTPTRVTLLAGQSSVDITVTLADDNLYEGTETLELELTGLIDASTNLAVLPAVARLDSARDTATGEIADNESAPHLFVSSVASPCEVTEGGTANFNVRLRNRANNADAPNATTVTVDVMTEDGTGANGATAGSDYTALTTTLTFAPGAVTQPVSVTILDDTAMPVGESDETFKVKLTNPSGAPIGGSEVTCTIKDDEVRASVADVSANENAGTLTFTVTLDGTPTADIHLDYVLKAYRPGVAGVRRATSGSSCSGYPTDYVQLDSKRTTPAPDPALVITRPNTQGSLAVTICDDSYAEPDEKFWLELTVRSGEAYVTAGEGAVGTIVDDETPQIAVADVSAAEGQTLEFKVNIEQGGSPASLASPVTLSYAVKQATPVSATQGADYAAHAGPPVTPLTGTLTFAAGTAVEQTLPVQLLADYLPESDETFELELKHTSSSADGLTIADASATATITEVPPPRLSATGFTGPEDSTQNFTVSLDRAPRTGETVTVDYAIAEDSPRLATSARERLDYDTAPTPGAALTGTLSFTGSDTSKSVPVQLLPDIILEADETFRIVLSNPQRAYLAPADASATGTITDVSPPNITVDSPSAKEGTDLTFTVTLNRPVSGRTVMVDYAVVPRSARLGRDYQADDPLSGTLTLTAANPTDTVTVEALNDIIVENDETLHLVLSNPQSDTGTVALGSPHIGVGTIVNVNPASVRVSDPKIVEGGTLAFVISVQDVDGSPATHITQAITVHHQTQDGTATGGANCSAANADYTTRAPGTVTFAVGGATEHTVNVTTCTDLRDEADETVRLALTLAPGTNNAGLGDATGTGTILDAPPPYIRIDNPAAVREGSAATFTVGLYDDSDMLRSSTETITVQYATGDVTATVGADYTAASGTLTFAPGVQTQNITVQTLADDIWEPEERFRVDLSRPANAILDRATGIGTIRPDCIDINDATATPPTITMPDERGPEGSLRPFAWVTLSRPLCDNFWITYRFVEGTTGSPATRADLEGSPHPFDLNRHWDIEHFADFSERARFPGFTTGFFGMVRDSLDEDDEYFYMEVNWSATEMPAHYQGLPWVRATVTIVDDDPEPGLRIADASADAGDALTFDVTLDAPSGRTVEVDYRTVDGTAVSPDDYTATASWTTLTFDPGDTTKTVTVPTAANTLGEGDETFRVELADPVNADIDDSAAVGTILAGAQPTLSIDDASGDEGTTIRFKVTLSAAAAAPVTVDYATVEVTGGADEGDDYEAASSTLTFGRGETEKFIDVAAKADSVDEADEIFLVELSNQTAAVSLADASAVGTINGNVDCVDRGLGETEPMPTRSLSNTSAREDAGKITVTITLTKPLCQPLETSFFAFSNARTPVGLQTATLGADYTRPTTVRLEALKSSVDFEVPLIDDELVEGDETAIIRVNSEGSSELRNIPEQYVTLTITDDDTATLELPAAADTSATEGGFLSFVVGIDKRSAKPITFQYATADGSAPAATAGSDYVARSGTATIAAGDLSTTVAVRTLGDAVVEADENVALTISNPVGADPDPDGSTAVGRIIDDDLPTLRITNAVADEGETLSFNVTLAAAAERPVTVAYATIDSTADGHATAGVDYTRASGSIVFAAGEVTKTVTVQSLTDTVIEPEERFWMTLYVDVDGENLLFDKSVGVGRIRDLSDRSLSVSDAVATEGGVLRFAVSVDEAASRDITVGYATADGTATAPADYTAASSTLTVAAGSTSATVEVATVQDSLDEAAERLTLTLSSPVGATIVDATATGLIVDDDPPPALSVSDAEATENGDGTPIDFTVTLSAASGRAVSVGYRTVNGTATAGSDYTAANGTLTFAAGETSKTVSVTLVNDDDAEEVETFQLLLSGPTNATIDDSAGVGSILDDDGTVQILADDAAAVYEADGATASFTVRLSKADPDDAITVDYATSDGTAVAGSDYTAASGTLTFAAGETSKTVTVALVNDDEAESTETFRLTLTNPGTGGRLGDPTATATIYDDDDLPTLSVSDATAAEGATASFTVSLSKPSPRAVTVGYATIIDPTASAAAVARQDYTPTSGTLTIAARSTSNTVAVTLLDDSLDEHDETYWLRLSAPVGATVLDGTGSGTITDNDPLPQLRVADASAEEGETLVFAVRLGAVSGRTVTVPWATAATATGNSATAGADFTAASGTITFRSGTVSAQVEVSTVEDQTSESDETFQLRLGTPTNAAVDDGVAVGAIRDDDGLPRISIADTSVDEDDSPATFAVTLSRASGQTISVDYATAEGTATNPEDYGPRDGEATGTLTIPAGITAGEISVFVADDDLAEGTETFTITLSNPTNAVVAEGAATATGTITDDEGQPRLTIADAAASEGDGTITFPVTLSVASTEQVTVTYTTFDGTATQPDDYTAATGTLTIAAGDTTAAVTVTLADDIFVEEAESFLVRLSNPAGAEIADAEAAGVIVDDDNLPSIFALGTVHAGENEGTLTFTVVMSHASDREVTVGYRSVLPHPGFCGGPHPFTHITGTLVYEPGAVSKTVDLPLVDNSHKCTRPAHDFRVRLEFFNPVNAVVRAEQHAIGHIWDDESVPNLRIEPEADSSGRWIEAVESEGSITFTLFMKRTSDVDVSVPYRAATISTLATAYPIHIWTEGAYSGRVHATAGDDFTATTGTATIPAGQRTTTISIPIVDDSVSEPTEHFGLRLTPNDSEYFFSFGSIDSTAAGVIIDNDGASLSIEDIEISESAGSAFFRVTLDRPSSGPVTVQYATSDGTATQPGDYAAASRTLTFEAGATEALAEVTVVDDEESESDETFTLTLSGATGATISNNTATAIIRDNDGDQSLPVITFMDATYPEEEGGGAMEFNYTLSKPSAQTITVIWQTFEAPWLGDRAATAGADYDVWPPTRFHPGIGETRIGVPMVPDLIPEHDERFIVLLSSPVNVVLKNNIVWGTIVNNDVPIVSLVDASASEGAGFVEFTLQLHAPGVEPATVRYTTRARPSAGDAAAVPGDDYTHTTGLLRIAAGATTATIRVPVIADTDDEIDKTFLLELSDPSLLAFSRSAAVGTITDDDDGTWIDNDPSVWENNPDAEIVFTVKRDHTSAAAVTVNYTVTGASAVGGASCTAGVDYITPSGTLTLAASAIEATIAIELCDDTVAEGKETLVVELTGVTGRKLTATGTITDND